MALWQTAFCRDNIYGDCLAAPPKSPTASAFTRPRAVINGGAGSAHGTSERSQTTFCNGSGICYGIRARLSILNTFETLTGTLSVIDSASREDGTRPCRHG